VVLPCFKRSADDKTRRPSLNITEGRLSLILGGGFFIIIYDGAVGLQLKQKHSMNSDTAIWVLLNKYEWLIQKGQYEKRKKTRGPFLGKT
jgi:hypothetical protein